MRPLSVERAARAGFCAGVRRAVSMAQDLIQNSADDLTMWGALIHNARVVSELEQGGMRVVEHLEELRGGETVLIRAHGISPGLRRAILDRGCRIVDASCPFVLKIHDLVSAAAAAGKRVYITGDPRHPEVEGIVGSAGGTATVLSLPAEAEELPSWAGEAVLVSQTTFSVETFREIAEILTRQIALLEIFDTICEATENRQLEAKCMAERNDVMLVIGSRTSSNTMKLVEVCRSASRATYLIEDADAVRGLLSAGAFANRRIGVTAGASTPDSMILEVFHGMSENVVIGNEHEETERIEQVLTEAPAAEDPAVDEEATATEAAEATSAADPAESVSESEAETPAAAEAAPAETLAVESLASEAAPVAAEEAPADKVAAESPAGETAPAAAEKTESMSFADMIEQIPEIHRGATVKGVIIRYDDENVYVDVNAKSEGRIPKHEFDATPEFDLDEAVATHREIDVYVKNIRNTDMGKEILLSKARVDFAKFKDQVEQAYNERTPITVKVVNVVKDGVIASYGGIDIYVHRTQLEIGTVEDLEPYRDQSFDILVTQFDPERRRLRVSGSRRSLLNRERKARAEELWATIAIGDIYDGVVRSLTDFGAFVDIGGVDGLVHISELSWTRIKHPSEVLSVGDVIQVYVKDFDIDRKRISLGYKRIEDDPYHNVEERFPVGSIITGKVVRMFNFGAFVEIAPGVDALCHISQISTQRLNQPQDVLTEGQEIQARVLDVSNEARRISISIRDVEPIDAPGGAPATAAAPRRDSDAGERRPRRGRRERGDDEFSQTSYSDSGQGTTLGSMLAGLDLGDGGADEDDEA